MVGGSQAELEPRLRGRARAELELWREEPGLEARGRREGGREGCGAGARARARGPSFRFSQLFPWPAAGRERKGGEAARGKTAQRLQAESSNSERERRWRGAKQAKRMEDGGERVVVEAWKEDSGKAIRFL